MLENNESAIIIGRHRLEEAGGEGRLRLLELPQLPEFKNNYFTEMCSGSEAGSYLRLIDFVSLNSRLESNKEEREGKGSLPTNTSGTQCRS